MARGRASVWERPAWRYAGVGSHTSIRDHTTIWVCSRFRIDGIAIAACRLQSSITLVSNPTTHMLRAWRRVHRKVSDRFGENRWRQWPNCATANRGSVLSPHQIRGKLTVLLRFFHMAGHFQGDSTGFHSVGGPPKFRQVASRGSAQASRQFLISQDDALTSF